MKRRVGRDAESRRTDQHQTRHPRRKLLGDKTGHHATKGKSHQVAGRIAQQIFQPLFNQTGQRIGIRAVQRRGRVAKTRKIGHQHPAPGIDKRVNIAQPVHPAAAVQQHQWCQDRVACRLAPVVPDHGARVTRGFRAGCGFQERLRFQR